MKEKKETQPAKVTAPSGTKQAGDIRDRWWWVEHGVWTKPMLGRLEASGPRTNWFGLWDKVISPGNLQASWNAVWRNHGAPGMDRQTISQFDKQVERELLKLQSELQEGRYRPQAARRVWIPKTGTNEKRPLGIPAVRDRVVQNALKHLLEPIFEQDFAQHSYGFRPGRGAKQAIQRVEELMEGGRAYVIDADLKSYFDTIPHDRLMKLVRHRITDGQVTRLIEQYLKAGVMEQGKDWETGEEGTPQGAVISPLLANLYLNELDHQMVERGWEMVRYADDFVVLCTSQAEAQAILEELQGWTEQAGLKLHDQKTRIVDAREETFDFLGWTLSLKAGRSRKWPRRKSRSKLRERLRPLSGRQQGESLRAKIAKINPILRGWHGYFADSMASGLRSEDQWLRRRLRSMLRKSQKRPGHGRTVADHKRWPNGWFAEQGLYSLERGTCTYA